MPTVEARLRQWQQELLDFSNRNALLNFRPSTSRPSTIQLIAPGSVDVYDVLRQGKALTILGNDPPENGADEADDDLEAQSELAEDVSPEPQLSAPEAAPSVRPGATLANLPSERAHRVLTRLAARARGAELEQGINTLFAVFGLLKWQDPRDTDRWQYAPLVMVPLRIEEITREGRFRIVAGDDDPEFNQTLVERLRRDFALDLSIEIEEETELDAVFSRVREAIARRPGWDVLEQVHLGHFQFYKLRMYEDLAEHADIARGHEIIQALGCDLMTIAPLPDGVPSEEDLDRLVPPDASFTILDADASQLQAVQAAIRGSHLIIQGPPGTGKSQTIANIIAECIASGRTVLFVSEKAAAIDVVSRRLEQQGLGDFCLMLHSHKANKRDIIYELGRQLENVQSASLSPQERATLSQLQGQRLDLDRYAEALHQLRGQLQESVFWAHSQLTGLQDVPLLATDAHAFVDLTHEQLDRSARLLEELATYAEILAEGERHPWAGVRTEPLSLGERERLRGHLTSLPRQTRQLLSLGGSLADHLGLPTPTTLSDLELLEDVTERVPSQGGLRACWFELDQAERANLLLAEVRTNAATLQELEQRIAASYGPGLYDIEPTAAITSYEQNILLRLFSSSHRALRARLRAASTDGRGRKESEELAALGDAQSRLTYLAWFKDAQPELDRLLGLTPQAAAHLDAGNGDELTDQIARAAQICRLLGPYPVPAALIAKATDVVAAQHIRELGRQLATAFEAYTAEMTALAAFFENALFPRSLDGDLAGLATILEDRAARLHELDRWARAQRLLQSAHDEGLAPVVQELTRRDIPPADWAKAHRRLALTTWLDVVLRSEPVLQQFDGETHDRGVARFRVLDRESVRLGSRRAREAWRQHRGSVSTAHGGEPGLLRFEANKRKRHLPLRRLFERIPNLLPTLKPCLMMSPLSVAHYLPADRYQFDVVIFDEASQVRPYDAIGAIMRGRQLIVAGDSRQLPPTTFFDRVHDDGDEDDSQDIRALESILDALNAKGMPSKSLLWHYRSRHEDLIAYSNHHFYDGRLITFPSPGAGRSPTLGVRLELVEDGRYEDEHDRVLKTPIRVNRIEARRVARLVMEHARTRPDESLLVVTLGMRQREVVEEEISRARLLELNLEEFFREDKTEPFYVKALEQVQGDERDVILISVGYGKNAAGVLSHNFGPINLQGGERRLNVLVTRARNQVVLVSSIRYNDIDPTKVQNVGPRLLRNYLEFAERGATALNLPEVSADGEYESPFEEQVGEALKRAGYTIHRQVGTSKYRIDLAVVDPRDPGRYLLGIECDGKTYHQSKVARDRDRIRHELLESLGWQLHRVWSTEWMRNPERELARITERIGQLMRDEPPLPVATRADQAQEAADQKDSAEDLDGNHESLVAEVQDEGGLDDLVPMENPIGVPYQPADFTVPLTELWETPLSQLTQAVVQCVDAEGPVHQDLLQRRLASLWGYQRAGSRIARRVDEAVRLASQRGLIRKNGAFLWPAADHEVVPRSPSAIGEVRQIAHIPDEEIASALNTILARAMSLSPDELVVQSARVFGYQRTGPDIRARILGVARGMHRTGTLEFRDGVIQGGRK